MVFQKAKHLKKQDRLTQQLLLERMWKVGQYYQEAMKVLHFVIAQLKTNNHEVTVVYQKHSDRIHHANQLQKITASQK